MTVTCRRCNRPLKNLNSILAGLGPVCAAKNAAEEAMREAETPPDNASAQLMVEKPFAVHGLVCIRDNAGAHFNIPQQAVRHSPTGMEFGYAGSGPADLALNTLLAAGLPREAAERHHQDFKFQFIAGMKRDGGTVPITEIRRWCETHVET